MSNELKTGGELVFDFLVMSYELCRLGVDTAMWDEGSEWNRSFLWCF